MSIKIGINAGHGGHDSGAVGNGIKEKDLNLSIALEVGGILKQAGIDVHQTRTTDEYVPLDDISKRANLAGVNYFVSIHVNAADNRNARGMETFHFPTSKTGKALATSIQNYVMGQGIFTADRGVKSANFAVLRGTKAPSALVELGFISNKHDAELLKTRSSYMAQSIADAILEHVVVSKTEEVGEMDGKMIFDKLNEYLNSQPTTPEATNSSKKGITSGIFADGTNDGMVDNPRGMLSREQFAVVLDRLGLLDD